jgi:hypothetical protein
MRVFLLSVICLIGAVPAWADMAEGDRALAAKDYPAAVAAYQAVLAKEPDNTGALRSLGAAYYSSGDSARSLGVYEAAIAKQPGDAEAQRFVDALKTRGVTAIPYEASKAEPAAPALEGEKRRYYGVRAGVGFGFPTAITGLGADVSTGGAYPFAMGGGLTSNGEFLWAFQPQLELGIGVQFIGNVGSYSSKDYNDYQEETYKVDSSVTPIDLTLYAIIPYSKKLDWIVGFGPAIALAADYDSQEESSYTGGSSTKTITKVGLDTGLGYHGLLGAEYKFNPIFSVLAGLDLESISLTRNNEKGTAVTTSSSGATVSNLSFEYEYVADAPKLKALTSTVNGTVTTTDDGVEVHTYDSATGKETSKKKLAKGGTVDFSRMAPVLKATFRF